MKKVVSLLMVMLLVISVFAGCNKSKVDDSSKSDETKETTKENKQVEIVWWEYPNFEGSETSGGAYEKEIIKKFNEKHPNIKVKLEMYPFSDGPNKLMAAIKTGKMPDLVYDYPGRIIKYARASKMAKLNDMFTDEYEKDVPDTILAACNLGEDYYMYPFNTAPFMMAFNKTMIEKLGLIDMLPLDRENRTWTVEEYEALLKAIKDKDPSIYPSVYYCKTAEGFRSTISLITNMYGGKLMNDSLDKFTLNSPGVIKGLEWVAGALDKGLYPAGSEGYTSNDGIDFFLQGKSASTLIYSVVLSNTFKEKKLDNFEEVFLPYPTNNGDPQLEAFIGGFGVFDNGDEDRIKAAKTFIDFLCNDPEMGRQNLKKTGGLSVRESVKGIYDDPERQYNEKMVSFIGQYTAHSPRGQVASQFYPAEIQAVVGKVKTPKEALDSFVELGNAAPIDE